MISTNKILYRKEYAQISQIMKSSYLNYSKDYDSEHVDLIYAYAQDDYKKGLFSWELFFDGIKEAVKNSNFFPTYSQILEAIKKIRARRISPKNKLLLQRAPDPSREVVYSHFQEIGKTLEGLRVKKG